MEMGKRRFVYSTHGGSAAKTSYLCPGSVSAMHVNPFHAQVFSRSHLDMNCHFVSCAEWKKLAKRFIVEKIHGFFTLEWKI